jgi:hypothetical protein
VCDRCGTVLTFTDATLESAIEGVADLLPFTCAATLSSSAACAPAAPTRRDAAPSGSCVPRALVGARRSSMTAKHGPPATTSRREQSRDTPRAGRPRRTFSGRVSLSGAAPRAE